MNIRVKRSDGMIDSIPCIKWHPVYYSDCINRDAGLWVGLSNIKQHFDEVNAFKIRTFGTALAYKTIDEYIASFKFAEADFMIYRDDHYREPWKNFGTAVRLVPYGFDGDYWNAH